MNFMICMCDEFAKHFIGIKVEIEIEEREFDGWGEMWEEKNIFFKKNQSYSNLVFLYG